MTRQQIKNQDKYEDHRVEKVSEFDDCWCMSFYDGFSFRAPKDAGVEPHVDSRVRLYGNGLGYAIRGLDIDGVEVFYHTEDEYRAKSLKEQQDRDAAQKASADEKRQEMDARVASLPDCFQKRIHRFRRNSPDFYWKHEGYEMASCVDAVKIASAMRLGNEKKPLEMLSDFRELSYEQQKATVPDLDYDNHSGNTMGMALRLAHHYLNDERLVFAEHAAISALVGCEEAGCLPVTKYEMIEAGYEPFEQQKETTS